MEVRGRGCGTFLIWFSSPSSTPPLLVVPFHAHATVDVSLARVVAIQAAAAPDLYPDFVFLLGLSVCMYYVRCSRWSTVRESCTWKYKQSKQCSA